MNTITTLFKGYPYFAVTILLAITAGLLSVAGLSDIAHWAIIIFSSIIAVKMFVGMVQELLKGMLGVDILAIAAITATIAVGEYWATIVIVLMMTGGEALEDYAAKRAKAELSALLDRAPVITHKKQADGTVVDVSINDVQTGDVLVVKPHEIVPVDGIVLEGSSSIDESSLTGESLPVERTVGDEVMSGAVNGDSTLTIRALRSAENSQYAQIVELVQAASDSRAPFVRMADSYAVPFTIISFAIAGVAWWLSGDALRFAQVLVVATPCPLLLGAPIAMISGMSRAAKHGIIVKSGAVLEQLARVKTAAFDKTGTLTQGTLSINGIRTVDGQDENELLAIAGSAEKASTHVMAEAIVRQAEDRGLTLFDAVDATETAAQGVRATISGKDTLVGKLSFLKDNGVTAPADSDHHEQTAVYVSHDGKYLGAILLADTVRSNAKSTLARLRELGVQNIFMLTGDNQKTAERIATELGVTDVQAECLPKDKLETVASFESRPVMMVGDGVNDAPVLAASDVGIAMGARGATAASESADVVVLVDDISRAALAVSIAKDTIRIATQSIMIGIAISIVLMLVAATGRIPAVVGAGLQEVVDVIVILNALRAHGSWKATRTPSASSKVSPAE